LVKTIERAEKFKKERLAWETEKAEKEKEKALRSSKNRPDVGQKVEIPTPNLGRKDSDAASELTMIEPVQATSDDLKKRNVQFAMDDDRRSFCSIDSLDDR
jgi:hypothetical protein